MEQLQFKIGEDGLPILGEWWPHQGIKQVVRPWAREAVLLLFTAIAAWAASAKRWSKANAKRLKGLSEPEFQSAFDEAAADDRSLVRPHGKAFGEDAVYPIARGRVWFFPPQGGAQLTPRRPDTHLKNVEASLGGTEDKQALGYFAHGLNTGIGHLMPLVTP